MDPRISRVLYASVDTPSMQSLAEFAAMVRLSSSGLRDLFQREFGQSPMKAIRNARLEKAAVLLKSTLASIKEISAQSGCRDQSHFVRDFTAKFGMPPTAYRRQAPPMPSQSGSSVD